MASRIATLGAGIGVAVASLGLGPVASAHPAPHVATVAQAKARTRNADILGQWVDAPGSTYGGTYTSEAASGKCKGTTPYGAGYALKDCKVTGDKLTFIVTYGSSYKSYNTDHVTGNTLTGSFHDTNGTEETYSSVRETDIPTTTTLTCQPAGAKARCTVVVAYDDKGDVQGDPTGRVTFKGGVHAASCTLEAARKADRATCAETVTPAHKGRQTLAVTATYGGSSAHFRKSSKATTVKVA